MVRESAKSTSALVGRGVLYRKRGKYKEALEDYLKALEIDPALTKAYYNAALIYDYYLPDPAKARQYYQKYVESGGDPAKLPTDTAAAAPAQAGPKHNGPANDAKVEVIGAETVDVGGHAVKTARPARAVKPEELNNPDGETVDVKKR